MIVREIVLASLLLGYMGLIIALGYKHSQTPVKEAETSYDFVPLDENFEKNQNDIVKWYAKIIYENEQKTKQ
jgi:hypothetical protein